MIVSLNFINFHFFKFGDFCKFYQRRVRHSKLIFFVFSSYLEGLLAIHGRKINEDKENKKLEDLKPLQVRKEKIIK